MRAHVFLLAPLHRDSLGQIDTSWLFLLDFGGRNLKNTPKSFWHSLLLSTALAVTLLEWCPLLTSAGIKRTCAMLGLTYEFRRFSLLDKAGAVRSTLWNLKLGGSLRPELPVGQNSNVPSHLTALLLLRSARRRSQKCISDEVLEQNQKCWSWAKTPNKEQQWENADVLTAARGAIFKYCQRIRNSPPDTLNSLNFKNWVSTLLSWKILFTFAKKRKKKRKEGKKNRGGTVTL